MSFLFSGIRRISLGNDFLVNGTAELPGLRLNISGNIIDGERTFVYGATTLNDFDFYNLTYYVPEGFEGTPEVTISFEKL